LNEIKYLHFLSQSEKISSESAIHFDNITFIHDQAFQNSSEGRIIEKLRINQNLIISLVLCFHNQTIGHIAYSPIFADNQIIGLGLGPVAVLPNFQNQGFGSKLIENGNNLALTHYSKIFVFGNPNFYSRFGFEFAKEYNYFSKYDPSGEHFMILGKELVKHSTTLFVKYCGEFDE